MKATIYWLTLQGHLFLSEDVKLYAPTLGVSQYDSPMMFTTATSLCYLHIFFPSSVFAKREQRWNIITRTQRLRLTLESHRPSAWCVDAVPPSAWFSALHYVCLLVESAVCYPTANACCFINRRSSAELRSAKRTRMQRVLPTVVGRLPNTSCEVTGRGDSRQCFKQTDLCNHSPSLDVLAGSAR